MVVLLLLLLNAGAHWTVVVMTFFATIAIENGGGHCVEIRKVIEIIAVVGTTTEEVARRMEGGQHHWILSGREFGQPCGLFGRTTYFGGEFWCRNSAARFLFLEGQRSILHWKNGGLAPTA